MTHWKLIAEGIAMFIAGAVLGVLALYYSIRVAVGKGLNW